MPAKVVPLFGPAASVPSQAFDVSHMVQAAAPLPLGAGEAVDLAGKPKVLLAIGAGQTGKTTFLRWAAERVVRADLGNTVVLATVDPGNRELRAFFPHAMAPEPGQDSAGWLERLLGYLMAYGMSGAIDFGGGDTSLLRLLGDTPDLAAMLEEARVNPVALYLLSPRVADLTPLIALESVGFKPQATALILNVGRADPTLDPVIAFHPLRSHPAYRAAIERGAVELWMPRLRSAALIENRRAQYHAAIGDSAEFDAFARLRTRAWLDQMDRAFALVRTWLPA